ncbi:MAG: AMP-binding protein [Magnetococcales bacterium]|nr:AMP-binding protein [Magnetococcales bacterium]
MKTGHLFLSFLLQRWIRLSVQGEPHLATIEGGVLIIANHPGLWEQWIVLAWLLLQPSRRPTNEKLLFFIHPDAPLSPWLRRLLPHLSIQVADPCAARGEQTLTASSRRLAEHLRAGGWAMLFPKAIPATSVSAARPQIKPYGWSLLAAQEAAVPVVALHIDTLSRPISLTLLPPRLVSIPAEGELRSRRHAAGQWAEDQLGEAALAHHLGRRTLWHSLCQAARQQGHRRLILTDDTGKSATYGQLLRRALILGLHLAKHNPRGAHVGILLPTTNAAITTFFALQAFGRIPALLNFTAGSAPLRSACRTGDIQTLYTSRLFVQKAGLEPLLAELRQESQVLFLEDVRGQLQPWQLAWGMLLSCFPQQVYPFIAPGVTSEQPAVLLFTSGSEGEPKGVLLSHDNLLANGVQMQARMDVHNSDILLNVLPLFHAFGLTAGTLLPLWAGMRCHCLPSPLDYNRIPEVAYTLRATVLAGTDTFLAGYARTADPSDFQWMRYVVAGAEPLRESTYRLWLERFGIRIMEGYGTTETSPVLSVNTPLSHRLGSVGRLLPGIDCRLDPVAEIPQGALLSVRGANIMLGYLLPGQDGRCHRPLSPHGEGWYACGDIVRKDAEGFLYILGRAKRFAKVGGEMISLAVVEQVAALAWPDHRHAVVAFRPEQQEESKRAGEQLVLLTEHPHPDRSTLLAQIRAKGMGEIYLPKKIIRVTTLPLLGSGKADYTAIQALVAQTLREDASPNDP